MNYLLNSVLVLASTAITMAACAQAPDSTVTPPVNQEPVLISDSVMTGKDSVFAKESARIAAMKYNIPQFVREAGEYVVRPLHWRSKDYAILGGVALGTAYFMLYKDYSIHNQIEKRAPYKKHVFMNIGDQWGGFFFSPALFSALAIHGWTRNNTKTKKIAFELAQSILLSEGLHFGLKALVARSRPNQNKGPHDFNFFVFGDSPRNSFPAGHIVNAFSVSTILSHYAKPKSLKILAYVPALMTCVSRVYTDKHWASDVWFSIFAGYATARWSINNHQVNELRLKKQLAAVEKNQN